MIICDAEQNTPEWLECRKGIPSSSEFDKIITTDGKPSKQREKYLYQLAGERVSGLVQESFQSDIMKRAKDLEDEARQLYSLSRKVKVERVGFCKVKNAGIQYGCSPDGLIKKTGLLEIKCPTMTVHIGYLVKGVFPMDYFQQTQGQLLVTQRKWVDFMSYFPGIKPFILRVYPDKKFQVSLERELKRFCSDLLKIERSLR